MDDASVDAEKATLHRYLRRNREALLWKLDGLSERDVRWPRTPTGTNLLGLVKHVAGIEIGYLGETFGRTWPTPNNPVDGDEDNADMWARADESTEDIVDLYRRAQAFADETIESLPLDATGRVPWWPDDKAEVTLHTILVHVIDEVARHTGHADIVREQIDGQAGLQDADSNLPRFDAAEWRAYVSRLEEVATSFESGQ